MFVPFFGSCLLFYIHLVKEQKAQRTSFSAGGKGGWTALVLLNCKRADMITMYLVLLVGGWAGASQVRGVVCSTAPIMRQPPHYAPIKCWRCVIETEQVLRKRVAMEPFFYTMRSATTITRSLRPCEIVTTSTYVKVLLKCTCFSDPIVS